MGTMRVEPVEGRKIRRPETGVEITEPVDVPANDGFYLRCIENGDLKKVEPDEMQFKEKPDPDQKKEPGKEPKKTPESKTKGGDPE